MLSNGLRFICWTALSTIHPVNNPGQVLKEIYIGEQKLESDCTYKLKRIHFNDKWIRNFFSIGQ